MAASDRNAASGTDGAPIEDGEIYGLVDWMREQDVKVGRIRLVTKAGEPVVVLIGRANRADDLEAAYDSLGVEPMIDVSFDPPVRLDR